MKLERMLSIITYLLNHEKVKARELADKFEVSVRTIYRDSLHSVSEDIKIKLLIEKLSGIASKTDYLLTGSDIMIDLSSWDHSDQLSDKIKLIRKAIQERRVIQFACHR